MPDWFPTPLAIGFLLCAAAAWLFLCFYNVVICAMPRIYWKGFLKRWSLVLLAALPVALFVFRDAPWLAPVLRPRRWHPVHFAAAAVLLYALARQIPVTLRILRPPRIPQLLARRTVRAPYHPGPADWAPYGDPRYTAQPRAGKVPDGVPRRLGKLPRYRRPLLPVRRHPLGARLVRNGPLRRIDQTYDLRVREFVLAVPRLPAAFDGLRVVQLADNHFGEVLAPAWHRHVVREANRLRPDLVLLTGDLAACDNLYRQSIEVLRPLEATLGVYAVRGNHDFHTEPEILAYWMRAAGITLLSNRHVDLLRGGAILRLAGVEHPYLPVRDWPRVLGAETGADAPFRIVLSHQPDNVLALERAGADLVLAGHTHGGQWRLPLLGPLVFPSVRGRRFDHGLHRTGRALLYCSAGLGLHTIPLRLNCPPEITLFVLRSTGGLD